ncbi:hypothetical protein KM043_004268 [Ampulex compressa]|nr:hypothetical protein KM043_004268 [Ampulex compressa]
MRTLWESKVEIGRTDRIEWLGESAGAVVGGSIYRRSRLRGILRKAGEISKGGTRRKEETGNEYVAVADCPAVGPCGGEREIEEMSSGTDCSYRRAGTADADKAVGLLDDFREVTVDLNRFDDIIEKIGSLHFASPSENGEEDEARREERKNKSNVEAGRPTKHREDLEEEACKSKSKVERKESRRLENSDRVVPDESVDGAKLLSSNPYYESEDDELDGRRGAASSESEEDSECEGELIERGPIRPQFQPPREQPYSSSIGWPLPATVEGDRCLSLDYYTKVILRDKDCSDKLNPCLDQLVNFENRARNQLGECSSMNPWYGYVENQEEILFSGNAGNEVAGRSAAIANHPREDSLLEMMSQGNFQAAQVLPDASSNAVTPPATKAGSESPMSSYNIGSSIASSHTSSPVQSPCSGANLESPLMLLNVTNSPLGSPQMATYRVPPALSSSSSSDKSYGNTPSPANYQVPLNRCMEEQIGKDLECFWHDSDNNACYESSETIVNSTDTVTTIDSSELQLVVEIVERDLRRSREVEEAQVVPSSRCQYVESEEKRDKSASLTSAPSCLLSSAFYGNSQPNDIGKVTQQASSRNHGYHRGVAEDRRATQGVCATENSFAFNLDASCTEKANLDAGFYDFGFSRQLGTENSLRVDELPLLPLRSEEEVYDGNSSSYSSSSSSSLPVSVPERYPNFREIKADFQIPETVASFGSNSSRRNSSKSVMLWMSLDLPSTMASEKLKEGVTASELEKAMNNVLGNSDKNLVDYDNDGDTNLMRLVANPSEIVKKKAYLAPLVERMGKINGALSMRNNRGEDVLYLAAIKSYNMSYITGYLAAAMLQKGIDISQKLYHTRGDTLVHTVAAHGDSHVEVLAELLALRTMQGNVVFDLSKCNYDGKTALHLAVESHDSRASKSLATVKLLLDNGVDPRIKETRHGNTALHIAVSRSSDPSLIKVLLNKSNGDIVNSTNDAYNTPLHLAAVLPNVSLERQAEIFRLLLNAGARCVQNRQGEIPFDLLPQDRRHVFRSRFFQNLR